MILHEAALRMAKSGATSGTYPNLRKGSVMTNLPAKILGTVISVKEDGISSLKERGATAVEYGIMVALIAAVIITVVVTLGTKLSSMFSNVATQI